MGIDGLQLKIDAKFLLQFQLVFLTLKCLYLIVTTFIEIVSVFGVKISLKVNNQYTNSRLKVYYTFLEGQSKRWLNVTYESNIIDQQIENISCLDTPNDRITLPSILHTTWIILLCKTFHNL